MRRYCPEWSPRWTPNLRTAHELDDRSMIVPGSSQAGPLGSPDDAPPWIRNPSMARIYNYILGGKDNYEVDRAVADKMLAVQPKLPMMARANRRFLFLA